MITCPNCGTQNEPGAHFCADCGANLSSLTSNAGVNPSNYPVQQSNLADRPVWVAGQGWVKPSQSPLSPPVEAKPPRTWFKALVLAIAILLLICIGSAIFASSGPGEHFQHYLETKQAEQK